MAVLEGELDDEQVIPLILFTEDISAKGMGWGRGGEGEEGKGAIPMTASILN